MARGLAEDVGEENPATTPVIASASEAIHRRHPKKIWIASSLSLLAMTAVRNHDDGGGDGECEGSGGGGFIGRGGTRQAPALWPAIIQ